MEVSGKSFSLYRCLVFCYLLLQVPLGFSQTILYSEDFTGQNNKGAVGPGTTDLTGITNWTITPDFAGLTVATDWFQVVNDVFEAQDVDTEQLWESTTFSIAGYSTITITMDLAEIGDHENTDYINVYYVLDGGPETLIIGQTDDFTSYNLSFTGITGGTLKLVVRVLNNAGTEQITFDNVLVTGDNTVSSEVTNVSGAPSDGTISLNWTNPGGCLDEVMIVGTAGGSITALPTGNGSAYTPNSVFGSGTDLGGGQFDVYEGTGSSATITGLTNGTQYCFTIFTRCDTNWSTGTEMCLIPWDYRDTLLVLAYNVLNYPGSTSARFADFRTIMHYVEPDIILCNEMVSNTGATTLLNSALNQYGVNYYAMATFVDGPDSDNMLYYNSNKVTLTSQAEITTTLRDVNHYVVSWSNVNAGTTNLHLFSFHLKAGTGATNETRRESECQDFRAYVDNTANVPANANVILGGDFNLYGSGTEPAWTELTAPAGGGTHLFQDPINRVGNWSNNTAYQDIHTQSTRSTTNPGGSGGATGGLDDRFDFMLINDAVRNGSNGVRFIPGTYETIGNDANKLNVSIIENLPNTAVPDSVRDALFNMSDHLPIVMKVTTDPDILVLPVELLNFQAELSNGVVDLTWITASEINSDYFSVERSADGVHFTELVQVPAAGNSNSQRLYIEVDRNPYSGTSFYRLKMIDMDGSFKYSSIRSVTNEPGTFSLVVYPNPSDDYLDVSFYSQWTGNFNVQIINMNGQIISEKTVSNHLAERRNLSLNVSVLPQGIYTIVINGRGQYESQRFIIRR